MVTIKPKSLYTQGKNPWYPHWVCTKLGTSFQFGTWRSNRNEYVLKMYVFWWSTLNTERVILAPKMVFFND
jgi:hypothetical protein